MDLKTYLGSISSRERREIAASCGTTINYLAQLRYGMKRPGPAMARALRKASGNRVTLTSMRPDIWPPQASSSSSRLPESASAE